MADLTTVFAALAAILRPYASKLVVKADTESSLYLDTRHLMANRQPLFFGAVQIKKKYVSFYLMPVYVRPSLLEGISPALRKRMQGKSCFNFTGSDPALLKELKALVKAGYTSYQEQGVV
jgi:hypothetical protein